jgi:hypothetical protein
MVVALVLAALLILGMIENFGKYHVPLSAYAPSSLVIAVSLLAGPVSWFLIGGVAWYYTVFAITILTGGMALTCFSSSKAAAVLGCLSSGIWPICGVLFPAIIILDTA